MRRKQKLLSLLTLYLLFINTQENSAIELSGRSQEAVELRRNIEEDDDGG